MISKKSVSITDLLTAVNHLDDDDSQEAIDVNAQHRTTLHMKDVHSRHINRLLTLSDKMHSMTQKNKVRQMARDMSARVLHRNIREAQTKPMSDIGVRPRTPVRISKEMVAHRRDLYKRDAVLSGIEKSPRKSTNLPFVGLI